MFALALILVTFSAHAASPLAPVDRESFARILETIETEFQPLAQLQGETLSIAGDWSDDWANAMTRRDRQDHTLLVAIYGGVARLPGINAAGFSAVVCHELGHGYGGAPWTDEWNHSSIEGQADYWAGRSCIRRVLTLFGWDKELTPDAAATNLMQALALEHGEPVPSAATPDPTEVEHTLLTFPRTVQCRLDTWLAGLENRPRPRCWFAP